MPNEKAVDACYAGCGARGEGAIIRLLTQTSGKEETGEQNKRRFRAGLLHFRAESPLLPSPKMPCHVAPFFYLSAIANSSMIPSADGPTRMISNGGTVSIIVANVILVGSLFAFSSARMTRLSRISAA